MDSEWAEAAIVAKGLSKTSSVIAEDLLSGPAVAARQLQLTIQTLKAIQKNGRPTLPGRVNRLNNGQLSVNVFPTSGLYDSLTFMGIRGSVRLQADVSETDIHGICATYDAIVWGNDAAEPDRRKQNNDPLLKKEVTSERGNVTPWIVVPGDYSERQLDSQAQHIATSITNNASFNCIATKVIVTWKNWPQRDTFLQLIQHHLAQTPVRPAYYPGAPDRFRRFTGTSLRADKHGCLPWTLLTGQSIAARPELFKEES